MLQAAQVWEVWERDESEMYTREELEMKTPWPLGANTAGVVVQVKEHPQHPGQGGQGAVKPQRVLTSVQMQPGNKASRSWPYGSMFFPLFCRVPLPQAPGLRVRRRHPWPDKLLQPRPVHRLVLLLDSQQGPPQRPRLWVSLKMPPWGVPWAGGVWGAGTTPAAWGQEGPPRRAGPEDIAGLAVSPQVRVALQVPGQWAVAADRPEGGEGDLRDPHARALRCRRVDDQVQHAVPHRRKPQLGLLQGSDREQPGQWTLHFSHWWSRGHIWWHKSIGSWQGGAPRGVPVGVAGWMGPGAHPTSGGSMEKGVPPPW